MSGWESFARVLWVLGLGAAIAVASLLVSRLLGRIRHRKPNSLVTHFVMAGLAIAAMYLASGGRWSEFGLGLGSFRWNPALLLWVLPTAILTIMQVAASRGRPSADPHQLGPVQTVLRVWIVASIAEELLTRGLVQSLLAPLSTAGFRVAGELVSVSVLLAALAFAAMHLVLVRNMGAKAAPVIVLAFLLGCVTGVYRQTAGSLIPAVIVHMLFNVGGTIPMWLALRRARSET
ncbi:MAG: CPBP family glutamic-type intramembrane protease [Candidatus Bipolaricaulota bacterium]|nr:CPBP family glutamic-type intramembrane protease [Candidatus Bipolaricaulota bacterium]